MVIEKIGKVPFFNVDSCFSHQSLVEGEIVNRKQNGAEHFTADEEMSEVSTAMAAGDAIAGWVERPAVVLKLGIPDLQWPSRAERLGISTVPRGHHAVKHVDPSGDSFEQVDGTSDAHKISRLFFREMGTRGVQRSIHLRWLLADAQAANGKTIERHLHQLLRTRLPKSWIKSSLDDGEAALISSTGMIETTFCPANRAFHRVRDPRPLGW